jgi:hypothetical protein
MKRVILLLVAGVALLWIPTASASPVGNTATKVTLDPYIEVSPYGSIFTGKIASTKKACKDNRQVIVYRVRDGADKKIGSTLSHQGLASPGYFWGYTQPGIAAHGKYYAKAPAKAGCAGDRSAIFNFT